MVRSASRFEHLSFGGDREPAHPQPPHPNPLVLKAVTRSPVGLLCSQRSNPSLSPLIPAPFSSPSIIPMLSSKRSPSSLQSFQVVFVPSSSLEQFVSCEIKKKKVPAPKNSRAILTGLI